MGSSPEFEALLAATTAERAHADAIRSFVTQTKALVKVQHERDELRAQVEILTAQRDAANDEANRLTGFDKWAAQDDLRPAKEPTS